MSNSAKQLELVAALLREESTVALATVDEHGDPCVAPLFYIVDENLSLFWLSSKSSQHSRNLNRLPWASATVYRPAQHWRDIRGVQMRGPVSTITEQGRRRALLKTYRERFQLNKVFGLAIRQSTLFALRPGFFRYIDNSSAFGNKFEIEMDRK